MGSVQRLATVVIVGLVALSTILFLYLGDEDNRISTKEEEHQEAAIKRGTANFLSTCLLCHGPAGEGFTEPGAQGTGRIGAPLGGVNTSLNQEGVNSRGTPWPGGVEARAQIIHDTIYNGLKNPDGTYRMPAFGGATGSLTDEQINELVVFIQHADWNAVYNQAIEDYGGYPTAPPAPHQGVAPTASAATEVAGDSGAGAASITIESRDILFSPNAAEIPANTSVTLVLPNNGAAPHNFSIDELGISVDLAPGETKEIEINAPAGTYEYYCNIPGHREAGMVGTLTVTEGFELPGAAPAGEAEAAGEATAVGEGSATAVTVEPVTIVSKDILFEPAEATIPADTDVTFILPNEGAAPHNFSIDELGISVDLAPGATEEIVINAPPGEYEIHCNVPGHREAGMVGKLIVTKAAAAPEGDAAAGGGETETVKVVSKDILFEPAELTIAADTDVTLELPNTGAAPHNFSIDELDISIDLPPGATEEVVIKAPAGTYEYYCNVPGHREAGMAGTLTVE